MSTDATTVDAVFAALADTTRRDIVSRVLVEESSVTDLARHYAMSFAAVQKHVAVLHRARLVTKVRRGRQQMVSGDLTQVRAAARLLDEYEHLWRSRVDRMDELLAADGDTPPVGSHPDPTGTDTGSTTSSTDSTRTSTDTRGTDT